MTVEGIDLSAYQEQTPSLAGLGFVIPKASEGNFADSRYAQHVAAARADGLKDGTYHFGRLEWTAQEQADVCLRVAPAAQFYAWDHERSNVTGTYPTEAQAREWIALVKQRSGKKVLLYGAEKDPWPSFPADNWGADGAWVAAPGYTPPPGWTFLQYSQSGGVDRDRYVGTADELAAFCGVPTGGGVGVKFIQLSSTDVAKLPTLQLTKPTPIEDFAGTQWTTIGPTTVHVLPGLVDAHSNRRQVVISTGRFYADGVERPTAQVAVLG